MNYCSECGSRALEHQIPEGDNRTRIVCTVCGTTHYQNPKIIVGCIPMHEGKVLLCRRGIEPRKGYWNFPAGFMENKETLQAGAKREVREEANAIVEIERLHTVYNILHVNQVYFLFLAKLGASGFSVGEETLEVKLFDLDAIPWEELAFTSNRFALEQLTDQPDSLDIHYGAYDPTKK